MNAEQVGATQAQRRCGLAEQAYSQICEAVLLGRYSPGDRINIRQLAAAMHVSTTPVREALSRLISEEVLEIGITRITVVPYVGVERLDEIFNLRASIEGELAEAAATRVSAAQLQEIVALQAGLGAASAVGDVREALRCNARFHFAIYEAACMPLYLQFVRGLWLRIGPTLHFNYPVLADNHEGEKRHNAIIEGLRARDAGRVRARIVEDLRGSQAIIRQIMQTRALTTAVNTGSLDAAFEA